MKAIKRYDDQIWSNSSLGEGLEFFHDGYQEDVNTELEGILSDGDIEIELEGSKYPGISCITPGNPYVLHCFPPFKTRLTKEQHHHLDIIANKIIRSFRIGRPIKKVRVTGHSARWHRTSQNKLDLRAIQRAGNAGNQLILRLIPSGYAKRVEIETGGRSDLVDWMGKPYSNTRGSQKAKNDRALNRRVEIRLIQSKKKKPKSEVPCELGEVIKKVNFSRSPKAERLKCLKKILILGVCKKPVNDRFWTFTGQDGLGTTTACVIRRVPTAHEGSKFIRVKPYRWHNRPAVFLDRNSTPLRIVNVFKRELGSSRDLKKIRKIMIWLEQVMNCNMEMLGQYLQLNCDIGPSGFKKDPNCAFVHKAHKLAMRKKPPSVYQCYQRVLKEYKATCTMGCKR